jgi:hypothetical protein
MEVSQQVLEKRQAYIRDAIGSFYQQFHQRRLLSRFRKRMLRNTAV